MRASPRRHYFLLSAAVLAASQLAHAEIDRWDTGQPIPDGQSLFPGPGMSASNLSLEYANLSNANLSFSAFQSADLQYATFQNSTLSGAIFDTANLQNANLSNTNLTNIIFQNALINGANFANSTLTYPNSFPPPVFSSRISATLPSPISI